MVRTTASLEQERERALQASAQPLWYVSDRRIRTAGAARQAEQIACWVATGVGLEGAPDEHELFVALHTCAYLASGRSRREELDDCTLALWFQRWEQIRSYLVEQNLGLAYSMIKRFGLRDLDLDDMRSEALWTLMRAVDRFNPWFNCKFSTYACNAIRRSLSTHWKKVGRYRRLFPVQHDDEFDEPAPVEESNDIYVERLQHALQSNSGELTPLESRILARRFPLNTEPRLTLQEIGNEVGLSNERVRQLQNRALGKLRDVLSADPALQ